MDQNDYPSETQSRFTGLTSQQQLRGQARICATRHGGRSSAGIVPVVSKDLGVSVEVVCDNVSATVVTLEC